MAATKARLRSVGLPAEVAREREEAFQDWLHSVETAYLECRNGHHVIPGITDERTELEVREGVCLQESACVRCGVTTKKVLGVKDGYIVGGSRRSYDYSSAPGYLLPKEACDGHAMDRDHRGQVRLELMERGFKRRGKSLATEIARDRKRVAARERSAAKKRQPAR